MTFAPPEGWRHVKRTGRHAAVDYAQALKDLCDTHLPDPRTIVLARDNLGTPKPAPLHEAFPAPEARRLVERLAWRPTPKHGRWLGLAAAEFGAVSSQCPDRRIPGRRASAEGVAAWQDSRNNKHTKADRPFTAADARVKLKRSYPTLWAT